MAIGQVNLAPIIVTAVNGTFTTTGALTVVTPASGKKFRLLGWALTLAVDTLLAAATGVTVMFVDNALATATGPGLASFGSTQAATGAGQSSVMPTFPGWTSGAVDRVLKVTASGTIGTGVIRVTGTVWTSDV